jgi:hypothetical protein
MFFAIEKQAERISCLALSVPRAHLFLFLACYSIFVNANLSMRKQNGRMNRQKSPINITSDFRQERRLGIVPPNQRFRAVLEYSSITNAEQAKA